MFLYFLRTLQYAHMKFYLDVFGTTLMVTTLKYPPHIPLYWGLFWGILGPILAYVPLLIENCSIFSCEIL